MLISVDVYIDGFIDEEGISFLKVQGRQGKDLITIDMEICNLGLLKVGNYWRRNCVER
jgi:hypothetical protein